MLICWSVAVFPRLFTTIIKVYIVIMTHLNLFTYRSSFLENEYVLQTGKYGLLLAVTAFAIFTSPTVTASLFIEYLSRLTLISLSWFRYSFSFLPSIRGGSLVQYLYDISNRFLCCSDSLGLFLFSLARLYCPYNSDEVLTNNNTSQEPQEPLLLLNQVLSFWIVSQPFDG